MKKTVIAAAILALALTASGCGSQVVKDSMSISQAQLTKQESQMKSLIQGDPGIAIFDFTADPELRTVSLACYKLDEKGEWVIYSGWNSFPVEQASGRIAITFDNLGNGMRAAVQSGDNFTAGESSIPSNPDNNTAGMSNGISYAAAEKIEYEKEIPLAVQVFTTKNQIMSCDVAFFYDPKELESRGYDEVYAVTVKFSKHGI